MNIPRSSLPNRTILANSPVRGIAVIELQLHHFPDSDRLQWWLCHRLNSLVSSYGDQAVNRKGIILHIIIVLANAASIALNASRDTLCSVFCNYNIRVTHRNGAIKHVTHESDPRRDHQQIVLYSFCRSMQHLHLAVKILLQIFLYEDLSTLTPAYICQLYFLGEYQQDRTLLRNQCNK